MGGGPAVDLRDERRQLALPAGEALLSGTVHDRMDHAAARQRHLRARGELPSAAFTMSKGFPAIVTVMLDAEGDQTFNPYAPEA